LREFDYCKLCPKTCGINRNAGELGYCRTDGSINVSAICIHKGEEPPISGPKGICNVFFSRCNMSCVFCQNYQISRRTGTNGSKKFTLKGITNAIIQILDEGIESVGFVTPSHVIPHVKNIILQLNASGYHPITVYNTNSYDKPEILRELEGLIHVYLPDFKYFDPKISAKYADTDNYPEAAKAALREMYRQKGSTLVLDEQGVAVTGMIIRHLVLPGLINDSINILQWIASELSPEVNISLMSQYYPTSFVAEHATLGRRLTTEEYAEVVNAMEDLGFNRGWVQYPDSATHYKPDFASEHPFEHSDMEK
jgi:putative pyruvate formate lyase activating enzyme